MGATVEAVPVALVLLGAATAGREPSVPVGWGVGEVSVGSEVAEAGAEVAEAGAEDVAASGDVDSEGSLTSSVGSSPPGVAVVSSGAGFSAGELAAGSAGGFGGRLSLALAELFEDGDELGPGLTGVVVSA